MIHQHNFEVIYKINYLILCSCGTNNLVFSNLNASVRARERAPTHTHTHRPVKIHVVVLNVRICYYLALTSLILTQS